MRTLKDDIPPSIRTQFYPVCDALRPYLSAIYNVRANLPDGETVEDWIYPEWANFRFIKGVPPMAEICGDGRMRQMPQFVMAGPTSKSSHFVFGALSIWGIGLLPSGWARFVQHSARDYADTVVDGRTDTAFSAFHALHDHLTHSKAAPEDDAVAINEMLTKQLATYHPEDPRIVQFHAALGDPEVAGVAELADRLAMNVRSMERLSYRAFGFSPKLLLRRQRFLRTLGEVMLDPTRRWTESLDFHYHDQAHFARDFKGFMGMSASDYMARPHPIIGAAIHGRMAMEGAPMQVLHRIDEDYGLR